MKYVPAFQPTGRRDAWLCPGVEPEFAYVCTGDCMVPTFYPGELAYIHPQTTFEDGQVLAIKVDGYLMLKRVYHDPDGVRCVPDNPRHKPFKVKSASLEIVGVAVARGGDKVDCQF